MEENKKFSPRKDDQLATASFDGINRMSGKKKENEEEESKDKED